MELAEATVATCGAKAAACGELARISVDNNGAFAVPPGACLPFGAMEAALKARPRPPRPFLYTSFQGDTGLCPGVQQPLVRGHLCLCWRSIRPCCIRISLSYGTRPVGGAQAMSDRRVANDGRLGGWLAVRRLLT